jgi:hypothetical protein
VIRVSTRFAGALLALLGAAAALRIGVLHDARGDDRCAAPGALKATSLIPGTTALGEQLPALDAHAIQWSEGEVANPVFSKLPMQFQIVRSYDAPALYSNPLAVASRPQRILGRASPASDDDLGPAMQPEDLRLHELEIDGARLPIHLAWDHTGAPRGPSRLAAWFFVFDNEPVRSPLASQLRASVGLALRGPRPLTLVTISAFASEQTIEPVEAAAVAWLGRAWAYVARSCGTR